MMLVIVEMKMLMLMLILTYLTLSYKNKILMHAVKFPIKLFKASSSRAPKNLQSPYSFVKLHIS